jgi:hypothetical protein
MKKIIRLTESELVSLVKRTIMEEKDTTEKWGCESLKSGTEDIEWCKCAIPKIKEKKQFLIDETDKIKLILQKEDFQDLSGNLKIFKKDDPFFEWRISQFLEVQEELTKNPKQNVEKINKFKREIANKALFVHKKEEKEEYSLLNKLNTNYSALSYLLTLYRKKHNLIGKPFEEVFVSYFGRDNVKREEGRESTFTNFILDYLSGKEDAENIMSEVFKTIEKTTGIGTKTEAEAYSFLVRRYGKENVKNYSGDYSFVDLFGIDFMVKGIIPDMGFLPVQIKTNVNDLKGNYRVAENIAMGKVRDGVWKIDFFDGSNFISTIK